MIKVDKNVPIPEENRGRKFKYPWAEMDVGDSFFAEGVSVQGRARLYASACNYFGSYGHIKCGAEGDGVRVWRIK